VSKSQLSGFTANAKFLQWTCRQDDGLLMRNHIGIFRVYVGLILAGICYCTFQPVCAIYEKSDNYQGIIIWVRFLCEAMGRWAVVAARL